MRSAAIAGVDAAKSDEAEPEAAALTSVNRRAAALPAARDALEVGPIGGAIRANSGTAA